MILCISMVSVITSLVAQTVKGLPTMWETWARYLGRKDSLEKEMATHSSTLAWTNPWMDELGAGYCSWGHKVSGTTDQLHFHFTFRTKYVPANMKNSAVATGLEKVSLHSSPKERQYQRMLKLPHNCTHLTY